jgi:GTPase SAR1 family protein
MEKSLLLKNEGKYINYASYSDKFNIIIMGEPGVGKTELLKNLSKINSNNFKIISQENGGKSEINPGFNNNVIEHISLEFFFEEKEYLIKIWNYCYISDTRLINDFMRKADAFIIVYSTLDKNSFNNIQNWINEAKNKTSSKKIKIFIIGNKSDKINERQVGVDEIRQFCEKDNFKFFEISSLNKNDLNECFIDIFMEMININYTDTEYSQFSSSDEKKNKNCCSCCKKYCNIF